MTHARFLEAALLAKELANDAKAFRAKAARLLTHHFPNGFSDAGAQNKPAWINEDAAGNIDGTDFTRADYMNIANLASDTETFFAAGRGDNVEKVAKA